MFFLLAAEVCRAPRPRPPSACPRPPPARLAGVAHQLPVRADGALPLHWRSARPRLVERGVHDVLPLVGRVNTHARHATARGRSEHAYALVGAATHPLLTSSPSFWTTGALRSTPAICLASVRTDCVALGRRPSSPFVSLAHASRVLAATRCVAGMLARSACVALVRRRAMRARCAYGPPRLCAHCGCIATAADDVVSSRLIAAASLISSHVFLFPSRRCGCRRRRFSPSDVARRV